MAARRADAPPPSFTLWKEILVAYLAPASTAGLGGLVTGQTDLIVAAFTSIGGTSALVAAMVGSWHLRAPQRMRPITGSGAWRTTKFGVGAGLAALTATLILGVLWRALVDSPLPAWTSRLVLDLPISATIATAMVTWRWERIRRRTAPGRGRTHEPPHRGGEPATPIKEGTTS
ncbi:hypothetical protein P9209_04325 [Prescottella defluvii]|nr:hypothetical protein P9209_04325 [Prescottella defluvii]